MAGSERFYLSWSVRRSRQIRSSAGINAMRIGVLELEMIPPALVAEQPDELAQCVLFLDTVRVRA